MFAQLSEMANIAKRDLEDRRRLMNVWLLFVEV